MRQDCRCVAFCGVVLLTLFAVVPFAGAGVVQTWDWGNGTLQGWTAEPPFGGALGVDTTFGNPSGSLFATDTIGGGGSLFARAPAVLSGDLSIYSNITWDEYIPDRGSRTTLSTGLYLQGQDGTLYVSDRTLSAKNAWNTRNVSFNDVSEWSLVAGNVPFMDVLQNVKAVFFDMDTSVQASGGVESWLDNVRVSVDTNPVPEPSILALLSSGLVVGFLSVRRRRYR